jgi:hypothetical protein
MTIIKITSVETSNLTKFYLLRKVVSVKLISRTEGVGKQGAEENT